MSLALPDAEYAVRTAFCSVSDVNHASPIQLFTAAGAGGFL